MKITAMYFQATGPLTGSIPLENEWSEEAESRILFTGPNGCGKSTSTTASRPTTPNSTGPEKDTGADKLENLAK